MRIYKRIIIVIVLSVFGFLLWNNINTSDNLAPDFEAILLDGSTYKLSDSRGKYVLLDFWAYWCPPCRKEIPDLIQFSKKYNDDVDIVTIALEKQDKKWKDIAQSLGFDWKRQIVEIKRFVMMSTIARAYGVASIPTKFLITPEGVLLSNLSFDEMSIIIDEH